MRKIVDLSDSGLEIIPHEIFLENTVEVLILDNNKIKIIPDEISNLKKLVELSLNNNNIQKISTEISKLNHLETISLSDNSLQEVPLEIFKVKSLKNLYLYNNHIGKINKRIKELTNLEILILSNNNLFELPNELGLLSKLIELDLSFNQLFELNNSILKLSKLELLNISNNQISELPSITKELPKLINLSLRYNPLELPPPEIAVERSYDDSNIFKIRKYFKEYLGGKSDYLFEIKLLLIGEGRVGKTSISKKLSIPKYLLKDEESTNGIEIKPWIISKKDFEKTQDSILSPSKNLRINIWDFGGQEIYHATHQFFLTKRSLYLLVTESRQEDKHEDFYYWLNSIKVFGDNSPTIIIQNKCDQPIKDIPLKELKSVFPNIQFLHRVSCKNNFGITDLKNEIKKLITNTNLLPHLGTPLPKIWVDIRREIENIQDSGKDYISYIEYLSICNKYEMEEERAIFLIEFFHDIGVVLYFKDDFILKDTVFVNHEWVTNSVYKVLDNKQIIANYGNFTTNDLESVWKLNRFYNKRIELLTLMKKFELCFELSKDTFLVPQLLQVDEIEHNWTDSKDSLNYYFQYKFMPKGILTRLIVKRNNDIFNSIYWRYGVILEYSNTKAIIREKYFDRQITINIQGRNKKLLLEIIKKSIKEIHSDFHNIEFNEMIPCCCETCKESISPYYFSYNELETRKKKKKETIECYFSYEDVKIDSILSNIQIEENETVNILKENKVFISYSHKDNKWLDKVVNHLTVLKKEGYEMDLWSDKKIKASQKWKDEISNSINSSKICILLISTDFLNSDFIINNELPLILNIASKKGVQIIPINLRPSRFTKNKILSEFQSINEPNNPLSKLTLPRQEEVLVNLTNRVEEILFS